MRRIGLSECIVPAATDSASKIQRRILEARAFHRMAARRQKQYANRHREDITFQLGDWVLLNSKKLRFKQGAAKLLPRWAGPFKWLRLLANLPTDSYARWKLHGVFHVSWLALS